MGRLWSTYWSQSHAWLISQLTIATCSPPCGNFPRGAWSTLTQTAHISPAFQHHCFTHLDHTWRKSKVTPSWERTRASCCAAHTALIHSNSQIRLNFKSSVVDQVICEYGRFWVSWVLYFFALKTQYLFLMVKSTSSQQGSEVRGFSRQCFLDYTACIYFLIWVLLVRATIYWVYNTCWAPCCTMLIFYQQLQSPWEHSPE